MKPLLRSAFVLMLVWALSPIASASALGHPSAVKQNIRITSVSAHCLDEFDEEDIVYIIEGAKVCKISVRVQGRGVTKSKVALEYYNSEDGWTKSSWKTQTTNTSGKASFTLTVYFPDQPEDYCYSGETYTHRFAIAKSGRYKAFRSASFEVSYTSADTNPACAGYDPDSDYETDYE